ncbi:MAG: CoA pyrophosphatase [Chloroflexota bacterium]|nr:CoA pyrophosphatase [Chloroflexota bacterium]
MRATNPLPPWDVWVRLAQAALVPGTAILPEQLLLVRDLAGNLARQLDPPAGVIPRQAAVLLLLYPDAGDLRLPLTVRSDRLPSHRGEVSLPGGAIDPDDDGPISAALREAHEELGVPPTAVTVWGTLSPLYISPSNFQITPVVGMIDPAPVLRPNDAEVSAVITVTVRELLDPALVIEEQWTLRGAEVRVPFFAIAGHKVWGATAIVLSEFVARMRRVRARDHDI